MSFTEFFLIWSPQGASPPKKRYSDYPSAVKDATRMNLRHPCQEFYILRPQSVIKPVPIASNWETVAEPAAPEPVQVKTVKPGKKCKTK